MVIELRLVGGGALEERLDVGLREAVEDDAVSCRKFEKSMSAKLGAMTARKPYWSMAQVT